MDHRDLSPLTVVHDEAALAILESLLEAEGLDYLVHNERFGRLFPGPSIPLFNERVVLVRAGDLAHALTLLDSEAPTDGSAPEGASPRPTRGDRIRPLLEFLLFSWFVPGRRRQRRLPAHGDGRRR